MFDDPVSSLDSDILFIVGSLIKGLFNEVKRLVRTRHVASFFPLLIRDYAATPTKMKSLSC